MEETAKERRKDFAVGHKSDEDRQAHIFVFRHVSASISKGKTEVLQATFSSLSPLNLILNQSIVSSVLSLVILLYLLSFLTFPTVLLPGNRHPFWATTFLNLRSHFAISQSKVLLNRAIGYLSELPEATCPEKYHSSFYSLFHCIFCGCHKPLFVHCHWPTPSRLSYDKSFSSLWHGFFSSRFQSFLVFAFLFPPSGRHLLLCPYIKWGSR